MKNRIVNHSLKMLFRNLKSYLLLSVTIVLSFTVLLIYLIYVDSNTYNTYKEIFASDENISIVYDGTSMNSKKINTLSDMISSNIEDAYYYTYFSTAVTDKRLDNLNLSVTFIPDGNRPVYREITVGDYNSTKKVNLIQGIEEFDLKDNEAVISESYYLALGKKELPFYTEIPIENINGENMYYSIKVVGIVENFENYNEEIYYNDNGQLTGTGKIYVSMDLIDNYDLNDIVISNFNIFIYSDEGELIEDYAKQLDLVSHNTKSAQIEARKAIQLQKQTKIFVTIMLLVILGVNMFSSLANVISKREFEIGVKRALGASKRDIIIQFLIESITIMVIDFIVSISLSADLFICYKWIYEKMNQVNWIVDISSYSVIMYLICCSSITILFSFILAYNATQVEVIDQLKGK